MYSVLWVVYVSADGLLRVLRAVLAASSRCGCEVRCPRWFVWAVVGLLVDWESGLQVVVDSGCVDFWECLAEYGVAVWSMEVQGWGFEIST